MQIPHPLTAALVAAALTTVACSREETEQEARDLASDARTAAARASDQLADSWLTTKIQAQYFADDDVKARHINVSTRDGAVVLTGSVDDRRAREQAVQIARNTDGVREVEDRLTIDREAVAAVGEAEGSEAVASAPSTDPGATSGAIPTTGTASAMPPVVAIDDEAVTTRIQAKYFLDNAIKARDIEIATQNGVVTVRGEVASEAERAQALLLARTTEGVQRVEDSLTVEASLASRPPATDPSTQTVEPAAPVLEPHDAPPEVSK